MPLHDITPITQEERATSTELVGDPMSHFLGYGGNKIQALSKQDSTRQTEPRSLPQGLGLWTRKWMEVAHLGRTAAFPINAWPPTSRNTVITAHSFHPFLATALP